MKKFAKIQFLSGIDEDGGSVGDEMKMIQKGYNEDLIHVLCKNFKRIDKEFFINGMVKWGWVNVHRCSVHRFGIRKKMMRELGVVMVVFHVE